MDIKFIVHNVAPSEEIKRVDLDGETVTARIPCVEVELTTEEAQHGSLTLRFRGAKALEASRAFKVGEMLSWSISVPVEVEAAA